MNWIYRHKELTNINDFPTDIVGFVYKITNTMNGKLYIGKKILQTSRKATISKREKTITKTQKRFKKIIKESDWLNYYGSSLELKGDVIKYGKENFKREILELCHSKKYMTYCEIKHQFKYDVLETDTYNGNIMSRFFRKDING
jgi:hypothetical protein